MYRVGRLSLIRCRRGPICRSRWRRRGLRIILIVRVLLRVRIARRSILRVANLQIVVNLGHALHMPNTRPSQILTNPRHRKLNNIRI